MKRKMKVKPFIDFLRTFLYNYCVGSVIKRIEVVERVRIVDLFSGAGGLTFGFYYNLVDNEFVKNENNHIVFANEFDKTAANVFSMNFPDINMINKDIKNLAKNEIEKLIGDEEIDLIIGGPPCQSYSTIGRRIYDDKAKMYNQYYRMLSIIKPKMFLFENVKGMLSMKDEKGKYVISDIQKKFAKINNSLGYNITYDILDAANFGVPQHRERVFIIGIRNDLDIKWNFESLKTVSKYITLEEAISDLPKVNPGTNITNYKTKTIKNDYQKLMRAKEDKLTCHFSPVYGEKIQTVINHVPQGEGKNYINKLIDDGILNESCRLTSGYNNTYGRLYAKKPCTTITNNLATPSALRCIHYKENRALTPREGARIQSFPDWFEFAGTKKDLTMQIGNAVPPLLAMTLANQLEEILS